jgi:serine/threonine protein kinase
MAQTLVSALAPGTVISERYRLDEAIGVGTFSEVFRATDVDRGHEVALKLLSPESIGNAGFERFCREAELAQRLRHPNTVHLLDFDLEAKPVPYIAYELLRGESLSRVLAREGPWSEARVAELASLVLSSLAEAHQAGIVHRDVKPENIFVCEGEDWVKVLDFGIAKGTGPADVALTQHGILIGTPRYMPPEQVRGESPSPAMDLYAVGILMAEALTGKPLLECSAAEACLIQLDPKPIALPELCVASLLGPIIRLATQKDLRVRYQYAEEMLADLERVRPLLSITPSFRPIALTILDPELSSLSPTEQALFAPKAPATPPPDPAPADRKATTAPPAARQPSQSRWTVAAILLLLLGVFLTAAAVYAWRKWVAP